jgi:phosphopantothenoylcysteine synthetase/decarboxylase
MRIFVTAGNTQVSIDRVRCITNIFTGRTGAAIALEAYRRGHQVTLVTSHSETIEVVKRDEQRWQWCGYRSFEDLEALMDHHIACLMQDAVVHCAAVSDYRAAGVFATSPGTRFHAGDLTWHDDQKTPALVDRSAGKVKSDEPELWLRLVRAPKLVDRIRKEWDYRGLLVKFKLEVGLSDDELLAIAEKSRQQSNADWMVANTLEGAADWAFIGNAHGYKQVMRADLAGALLDVLEQQHQESQRG